MTDITARPDLGECPFCGDKDDYNPSVSRLQKYAEPGDVAAGTVANPAAGLVDDDYYVECDKCAGCGPPRPTEAEAVAAWNQRTRPHDAALAGKLASAETTLVVGERFVDACFSAWACGEPEHRVKTMLDLAEQFRAALAVWEAGRGE